MTGSLPGWLRGPAVLAAAVAVAAAAAGCSAAVQPTPRPARAAAVHPRAPSRPRATVGGAGRALPSAGGGPGSLAGQLTSAERALEGGGLAPAARDRQALIVQLVCLRLASHPGWGRAAATRVAPGQRAAAAADIAATADLVALTQPQPRLPRWRIVAAPSPAALRADYRAAQAATGVGWSYLAAVNFVETDFGRILGASSAGAQGPMQFLPATWASYGHGSIHRPRNAIFAAARLLRANGGAHRIGPALYAYNHSWRYVDAVLRYARRLRTGPRAFAGYYSHQVMYRLGHGWVLLPPGYGINPAVRPIRPHL